MNQITNLTPEELAQVKQTATKTHKLVMDLRIDMLEAETAARAGDLSAREVYMAKLALTQVANAILDEMVMTFPELHDFVTDLRYGPGSQL